MSFMVDADAGRIALRLFAKARDQGLRYVIVANSSGLRRGLRRL
jgi:hypothetical protein